MAGTIRLCIAKRDLNWKRAFHNRFPAASGDGQCKWSVGEEEEADAHRRDHGWTEKIERG
jgi:hypothetical protein